MRFFFPKKFATSKSKFTYTLVDETGVDDKIAIQVPYLIYSALMTQTGTSAPTATVLQNTTGTTISWAYGTVGSYTGTLDATNFSTHTPVLVTSTWSDSALNAYSGGLSDSDLTAGDESYVQLDTGLTDSGAPSNARLDSTYIEIRFYPA